MAINRQEVEQEAKKIINDKTWKGHATLGIILLIIAGVVSSPIFTLVRAVLEIVLGVGGLLLIGWAVYQYVQLQEKK